MCAIGNFDGVHRGHVTLLSRAASEAAAAGLRAVALTFDPPPSVVLGRGEGQLLTTTARKIELIERAVPGIEVVVQTFDRAFADTPPEDFASRVLASELGAVRVVVGTNFRFGRDRAGDLGVLQQLGGSLGFEAEPAPILGDELGPWSSSRARKAILAGHWDDVSRVLGRPHAVSGLVAAGDRRGRTLGFPTANLAQIPEILPPGGVYAVRLERLSDGGQTLGPLGVGVANLGVRPTFDAGPSVEIHVLDFDGDLYGARLRAHFVSWLRDERRFPDVNALVAQIRADIEEARAVFSQDEPELG